MWKWCQHELRHLSLGSPFLWPEGIPPPAKNGMEWSAVIEYIIFSDISFYLSGDLVGGADLMCLNLLMVTAFFRFSNTKRLCIPCSNVVKYTHIAFITWNKKLQINSSLYGTSKKMSLPETMIEFVKSIFFFFFLRTLTQRHWVPFLSLTPPLFWILII